MASSGNGFYTPSSLQRPASPPLPIRHVPPPLISDVGRSPSSDTNSSSSTVAPPSSRFSLLGASSPPSSYGREHRLSLLSSPGVFDGDDQRAQFLQNLALNKPILDDWQLIDAPVAEPPPTPPDSTSRRSSIRRLSAIMSFGDSKSSTARPGLKKSNSFFRRLAKGGHHDEETAPPVPDVAPQIPRLSTFLLDKDQPLITPNTNFNRVSAPQLNGHPQSYQSFTGPRHAPKPGGQPPSLPPGAGFGSAPVPNSHQGPMSPTSPVGPTGHRMAPWSGGSAPERANGAPTPPPRHPMNQPNQQLPNGASQPSSMRASYQSGSTNGHGYASSDKPNGYYTNGSAHGHSNGSANGHANGAMNIQPLPSRKGSAPVPYLNKPNGYGPAMSPPTSPTDGKFVQRHIPYSQPHQVYSRPPLLDQPSSGRTNTPSVAATPSPPPASMGSSQSSHQPASYNNRAPPARQSGPLSPPTSPPQRATPPEAMRAMSPPQSFALPPGAGPAQSQLGPRRSHASGVPTQQHVFQQNQAPPPSSQGHGHERGYSSGFNAQSAPASRGAAALQRISSPPSSHGHTSPPLQMPQPNGQFAARPQATAPQQQRMANGSQPMPNGHGYDQQQQPMMATRPARSTSVSRNSRPAQASPPPPLPNGAEVRRWSSRPNGTQPQPNGTHAGMVTSSGAIVEIVGQKQASNSGHMAHSAPSTRPQPNRQTSADDYGRRVVASPPPEPARVVAPVAPPTHHSRPPEKPERSAERSRPQPQPQPIQTRPPVTAPAESAAPIVTPTPRSATVPRPTIVIPQPASHAPPPKPTPYEPTPVNVPNVSNVANAAPPRPPVPATQQNGHPDMGQGVSRAMGSHSSVPVPSLPANRVQPNGYQSQVGNGLPSALKGAPSRIRTSGPAAGARGVSSPLASPVNSTAPRDSMPPPARNSMQPSRSYAQYAPRSSSISRPPPSDVPVEDSRDMVPAKQSVMSRLRPARRNEKSLTYLLSHPRVVMSLLPFLSINQFLNLLGSDQELRKYITGEMVGRWVMREWGVTVEKERGRSWPGLTVWEGFLESLLHDPAVYSTYPERYHNLLRHLSLSHTLVVLFLRTMPASAFPFSAPLPFDDDLTPPQLHKSSSIGSLTSGMMTPPRRPGSRPGSRAGSVAGSEPGSPFGRMPRRERVVEVVMPEPLSATPKSANAATKPWDTASIHSSMGKLRRRRGSGGSVQSTVPVGTFGRKRAQSVSSMNTAALQAPSSHHAVPLPQGRAGLPPVSYPTAKRYEFTNYGHRSAGSTSGGFSSRPGSIMSAQTSAVAHSSVPNTIRGSASVWGSRSTTQMSLAQYSEDLPVPPPIGRGGSHSSFNGSDSHRSRNSDRGSNSPIQRRWDSPTQNSKFEPAFDRPPPYMPGRAPILRVFVPITSRVPRWPSVEGAAASWRELEKCGASKRMRLGDLVVNTALSKPVNTEHVLIYIPFIEHKLVPLEYNHCVTGNLPHYLDAFALSPMYYDPFLPTPQIIYLDFSPFAMQAMQSVRLAHDRRDVTVSSGARVSAKRYLHVAGFEVVPTPDERIAKEWAGQISLEAEGTAEGRHEMEARFGFGDPTQCVMGAWEVVRERSMVGSLWLRLVREEPRVTRAENV